MAASPLEALRAYLEERWGASVRLLRVGPIGELASSREATKRFGYGRPVLVEAEVRDGRRRERRRVVLHTMRPGPFGHEHMADRAQCMLRDYWDFNKLPRHVRSLDVGYFGRRGVMHSVADAREFFLVTEYVRGRGYNEDLERILRTGRLTVLDRRRVRALARYLAGIHRIRRRDPALYRRRLRELIGHGECIMGITDSYPSRGGVSEVELRRIEERANAWRWRLRTHADRLCQVHGDFHPWNVLFEAGERFHLIDRARGEWGEAADDLTAMSINYLFFSLRRWGDLRGPFAWLWQAFWETYLEASGDRFVLTAAPPFFAFRGLVLASPVWYPEESQTLRRRLIHFVLNVLAAPRFEPERVNDYLEEPAP